MSRIRSTLSLPCIDNSKNKASIGDGRMRPALVRVTGDKRQWNPAWGVPPWNRPTS